MPRTRRRRGAAALGLVLLLAGAARADEPAVVSLAYLGLAAAEPAPASALETPAHDVGLQGARLGLADDQTTGAFTGQHFVLQEAVGADDAAVLDAARALLASGQRLIVADLPAPLLLLLADLPEARDALVLDAGSADDRLRGADCRPGVLHLLPSWAMRADALMQYLAVKGWHSLFLVAGPTEADRAVADAMRRSAAKFRLRIVADKAWTQDPGAQRTDTGHVSIGAEVARFTQGISYDVLVVADTADAFGGDLAYRTSEPRPVAGTHGLMPVAWAPAFEQWGATQLQLRFRAQAGRVMTVRDYGAWMAVRAIGEAATRGGGATPAAIMAYLRSPRFELAAFKGVRLGFRTWNGQLRQPVLLADAHGLVSVSPQPGYLHQRSELDTLGADEPETSCHIAH